MYCSTCNRLITSNSTPLLGHNYHPDCLYCSRCKTKLWNKPFIKKSDGKLFCENLCGDDFLINLPPIKTNHTNGIVLNGNANLNAIGNSFNDLQKSLSLKRRQSNTSKQTYLPTPQDTFNTNEQSKFLPNAEVLRRRELLKKKQEPFNFNYSEDDKFPIKPLKPRNKAEPFSYNRSTESGILDTTNKTPANELPAPRKREQFDQKEQQQPPSYPLNYVKNNNDQLNKVKASKEQYRLANISPFALHTRSKYPEDSNQNDTIAYCDMCHQFIEDNQEKCTYNNQTYHKRCFRCVKCLNELYRLKKMIGINGEYYCEPCYNKEFSPKCPKCNEPIASYMLTTTFENKLYHKECFVCQRCKKYTVNETFAKAGNMIVCRNCF